MSFFGFETTLPPDDRERRGDSGHNRAAPGFAQPQDAFAGLSNRDLSAAQEA
jgi:Topoisomerase II-associated protein PAT1